MIEEDLLKSLLKQISHLTDQSGLIEKMYHYSELSTLTEVCYEFVMDCIRQTEYIYNDFSNSLKFLYLSLSILCLKLCSKGEF